MQNEEINIKGIEQQKPYSVWFIGLSGAGKTTLASALKTELDKKGFQVAFLDADEIRKGLNADLGYSLADRKENNRRVAELSKVLLQNGIISLNAFICPTEEIREMIRDIIGFNKVLFVYLSAPFDVCEKRDAKGLYARAKTGQMTNFTGVSSVFEIPATPDLTVDTAIVGIEESIQQILEFLIPRITI